MISFLEGTIDSLSPSYVILNVSNIGYHVYISLQSFTDLKGKDKVRLYTHLQVKEDAHNLYGFITSSERLLFQKLISVSGVGPSTGLAVLSTLSVEQIYNAILNEDVKQIESVKGIGPKSAKRLILELKDKLMKDDVLKDTGSAMPIRHQTLADEALSALMILGFTKSIAEKSISKILSSTKEPLELEEVIKRALKTS